MEKIVRDAKIGKIAKENPDLGLGLIRDILVARQEAQDGKLENYPLMSFDTSTYAKASVDTQDERLVGPIDL